MSACYWPCVNPESAGFSGDLEQRLMSRVERGALDGLHALVVVRNGQLVFERYFDGEDVQWIRPLGRVRFDRDTLHDVRSVSKSIVGLLYGIALSAKQVPNLDTPLVDGFPGLGDLVNDAARRSLTVRHALTMTLGLAWNEDLPYTDPRNGEVAMERAQNRERFVLEQPIVHAAGERWSYCGGATALLASLLRAGTGMSLLDYARTTLLEPLGVMHAEWTPGTDGHAAAASGLRLCARDLARVGQLLLDQGQVGGQQVVPGDWLEDSLSPHVRVDDEVAYGLHWWIGRLLGSGRPWWSANGNGGQRLFVAPSLGVAIVVLCGNYNQPGHWKVPVEIISNVVLASLRRADG